MANPTIEHSALFGDNVHEDHNIADALADDAGKILFVGVELSIIFDQIPSWHINEKREPFNMVTPIGTAATPHFVSPANGKLVSCIVVPSATVTGTDTLTFVIDGTSMGAAAEIDVTGSAGDVISKTFLNLTGIVQADLEFTAGSIIKITNDGGATGTGDLQIVLTWQRHTVDEES